MFKKCIASITMLVMVLGVSFQANAQDKKNYIMWENVLLTPDYTNLKVFGDNMRKHNEAYHKEGPYKSTVYNISTGPNAGKIIWQMGPMLFKHNDSRPKGRSEEHTSELQSRPHLVC